MSSLQIPAQTFPVGETMVPSKANQQTFPQRQVSQGIVTIPLSSPIDANTAADFHLELMLLDGTWTLLDEQTVAAATRHPISQVVFEQNWDTPITVKGLRLRVDVRDFVAGSGLAQPVSVGASTVTWN